jgi:thiamine biosynthesis protein ThiS
VSNLKSATEGPATIEILLNGDRLSVPAGATLAEILVFLGLPADRIAVELDRKIVRKTEWENCRVSAGAEVEVVHFVGGGSDANDLRANPNWW